MKYPFPKLFKDNAQHTVEYMTMIILIIAGIIIGGPYVIRSWNAQMKGWDDSVTDSLHDPLKESAPLSVPGCDPQEWSDITCNTSMEDPCTGITISCGALEMLSYQSYDPPKCQCDMIPVPTSVQCTPNSSCCTAWTPTTPNPATDCGVNATPDCPDGQMRQNRTCGSTGNETQCVSHASCVFLCQPGPPPSGTGYAYVCPGSTAGLTSNTTYWTTTDDCNSPGPKCRVSCDVAGGYTALGGGISCGLSGYDHSDGYGHAWRSPTLPKSKQAALEACQKWMQFNYPGHECQCANYNGGAFGTDNSYATIAVNCNVGAPSYSGHTCCDRAWEIQFTNSHAFWPMWIYGNFGGWCGWIEGKTGNMWNSCGQPLVDWY